MVQSILKYSGKYKKYTFAAVVLVILAVIAGILPFFFAYQIIAPLILGQSLSTNFIVMRVVLVGICLILNPVLYISGLSLSHISAFNTLCNLRMSLQHKMENLPLGIIQEQGIGRLKRILVDEVESLELLLAHAIPEGIGNSLIPVVVFIYLFFIDWKLAFLTLASVPIGLFGLGMMLRQGFEKMEKYYQSGMAMNNTIIEYINGMEVVKVFNKEGESYQKYKDDVASYRDFTLEWYRVSWPWMSVYTVIFACIVAFTIPFGALLVVKGYSTLPNLILVLCLSFSVGSPLLKALHFVPSLTQIKRKVDELEKTFDYPQLKQNNKEFIGKNYDVEYKNVTFAYKDEEVIKNSSLFIKQGSKTALVGESGSGKSTLAKLLVHYYDVKDGSILIGGQDITDMSLESLNKQISFVSQDQFLFNTSIFDNIKVGKPNATKEEVLTAAHKAQCDEFIEKLENGIYTLAGDCGNQLSGGEKQRVSLARAILKNAPIVVLDEATAFADPENEEKMNAAIKEVVKGKTLLVIAHRLTSITDADCIYVVDKGEISGFGTHKQLLKKNIIYKRLWKSSNDAATWSVSKEMEDENYV